MIPLIVGAMAASAAANIASSAMSANASRDAAAAAAAQEQKALDQQKEIWQTTQNNEKPYLEAGEQGLGNYVKLANESTKPVYNYQIPDFQFDTYSDPGAEYRMAQAAKAINNSSISKGLVGGGAIKALASKQQEMAGNAYSDAWNRYLQNTNNKYKQANDTYARDLDWQNQQLGRQKEIMNQGASVASGLGQIGATTGKDMATTYGNIGSSNASGIIGGQNAINQGITGATNGLIKGIGYLQQGQTNDILKQNSLTNGTESNGWEDVG